MPGRRAYAAGTTTSGVPSRTSARTSSSHTAAAVTRARPTRSIRSRPMNAHSSDSAQHTSDRPKTAVIQPTGTNRSTASATAASAPPAIAALSSRAPASSATTAGAAARSAAIRRLPHRSNPMSATNRNCRTTACASATCPSAPAPSSLATSIDGEEAEGLRHPRRGRQRQEVPEQAPSADGSRSDGGCALRHRRPRPPSLARARSMARLQLLRHPCADLRPRRPLRDARGHPGDSRRARRPAASGTRASRPRRRAEAAIPHARRRTSRECRRSGSQRPGGPAANASMMTDGWFSRQTDGTTTTSTPRRNAVASEANGSSVAAQPGWAFRKAAIARSSANPRIVTRRDSGPRQASAEDVHALLRQHRPEIAEPDGARPRRQRHRHVDSDRPPFGQTTA